MKVTSERAKKRSERNQGSQRQRTGLCLIMVQHAPGYNELDAMLVLKDILAHEYMDKRQK